MKTISYKQDNTSLKKRIHKLPDNKIHKAHTAESDYRQSTSERSDMPESKNFINSIKSFFKLK